MTTSGIRLITHNCAGLGNRIKCLTNCLQQTNDVKVHWPKNLDAYMQSHDKANINDFDEIFNVDLEVVSEDRAGKLKQNGYRYNTSWRWNDSVYIDCDYTDNNTDVKMLYHSILTKRLTPSDKVLSIVENRMKLVSDCELGVFIRTGDTQNPDYPNRYNMIEDFNINKKTKTFIVGDSPRVYEYFRHWSNVVCFLEDDYIYSGWPSHFANILLLAKCPSLKLPETSTYTEVVYIYSNLNSNIEFIPHGSECYGRRNMEATGNQIKRLKKLDEIKIARDNRITKMIERRRRPPRR